MAMTKPRSKRCLNSTRSSSRDAPTSVSRASRTSTGGDSSPSTGKTGTSPPRPARLARCEAQGISPGINKPHTPNPGKRSFSLAIPTSRKAIEDHAMLVLLAATLLCLDEDPAQDLNKLEGTWTAVSWEY